GNREEYAVSEEHRRCPVGLVYDRPTAPGVGGPASCEEAAKRCTSLNWTVGPTLIKGDHRMFAAKKSISRRTILRGAGAAVALPFLEAMVPAFTPTAQTAANPLKRFGAVFVPLGERPGYWTPTKVGADFEFTPILKPLEPFRKSMTVISELCDPLDGHAVTVAAWLSGSIPFRTIAENVKAGTTIDQVIANKIGQDTPLPSLELATEDFTGWIGGCDTAYSCAYMNTISWKTPTTPLPMEINPRVVFERMFGRPGTRAQRLIS